MTNAIEIKGLGKRYRRKELGGSRYRTLRESLSLGSWKRKQEQEDDYFWALRDVNLNIDQGDVVGVIGPNGAGKSTLLKLLSRVTAPTEGNFRLRGRVASLLEVGTGFHPELTGRENIYLSGAIMGMRREEIKRSFDEIVAFSGVEQFLDLPVKRYSSGMYVRLGFAIAAHLEAEIILVDEVLAVGDAAFQKKCLGKIGDVAKGGRTVLFVSHNLGAVREVCEKGIVFSNSKMCLKGDIDSVLLEYRAMVYEGITNTDALQVNENNIYINARIQSVRLLDKNNASVLSLMYGEAIRLKTELWSDFNQTVTMVVGINDIVNDRVLTSTNTVSQVELNLVEGLNSVVVRLPSVKLKPGFYGAYFSVINPLNEIRDSYNTKPFFEILSYSEKGNSYGGYWGRLVTESDWEVLNARSNEKNQ